MPSKILYYMHYIRYVCSLFSESSNSWKQNYLKEKKKHKSLLPWMFNGTKEILLIGRSNSPPNFQKKLWSARAAIVDVFKLDKFQGSTGTKLHSIQLWRDFRAIIESSVITSLIKLVSIYYYLSVTTTRASKAANSDNFWDYEFP